LEKSHEGVHRRDKIYPGQIIRICFMQKVIFKLTPEGQIEFKTIEIEGKNTSRKKKL
jgi:hypothetical protein